LDAAAVAEWADACVHTLDVLCADINGINVYPIADSDTGSNLLHTVTGARDALRAQAGACDAGQALGVLARGAVHAARGNSGVILSQVLRGFAESAGADCRRLDGPGLAAALVRADSVATAAVARPVEGTMLTVLHEASASVSDPAVSSGTAAEVATAAAASAAQALERTPDQLPVLASAGVVDAGGRGLLAVLDALVAILTGHAAEPRHALAVPARCGAPTAPPESPVVHTWEVMYLLDGVGGAPDSLAALRASLSALGDSVTVAGDGAGSHAVHVHCGDIGAAIEAGLDVGRPHRIRVEPLLSRVAEEPPAPGLDRAVVAVVHGDELAALIRAEGVPVLAVGTGSVPSAEELIGLITETAAGHITVLPGGMELTASADRVAGHAMLEERDVVVVPCASPVQVLAALAVHDIGRRINDDVVAMAEAAAATRRGELRVAAEEALTWAGRAHAGDVLGLVDGEVQLIVPAPASAESVLAAAMDVLGRMLDLGGELVTVLTGVAAPPGIDDVLARRLRAERPEVELVCYPSGGTDAVLLIGVE
jgi:DAK2 domain fusion protein YloV